MRNAGATAQRRMRVAQLVRLVHLLDSRLPRSRRRACARRRAARHRASRLAALPQRSSGSDLGEPCLPSRTHAHEYLRCRVRCASRIMQASERVRGAAPRRAARHHARRSLSAASDTAAVLFGWLSGCVSSRWPPPQATMAPWASWRARWRVRQPRADAMASAASRAFETCI